MMKKYYDTLPDNDLPKYDRIAYVSHMNLFLQIFKSKYGDVYNYLKELGLSEKEICRLKFKCNGV